MPRPATVPRTALPFLCAALVTGCPTGPHPAPRAPAGSPPAAPAPGPVPAQRSPAGARPALVGIYCPELAGGRPAVDPLFVRAERWSADPAETAAVVQRRAARQLSVLGWDGRRVGVFSVAGAAKTGGRSVAIGSYAGASPCARGDEEDPACVAATAGCGVAVAVLEEPGGFRARPFEEEPDPVDVEVGGACAAAGGVVADIDRDGAPEAFAVPASAALPPELVASDAAAECAPRFAGAAFGGAGRVWAAADVDADGRLELLVRGDDGTWALYAAPELPTRLERAAVRAPVSAP